VLRRVQNSIQAGGVENGVRPSVEILDHGLRGGNLAHSRIVRGQRSISKAKRLKKKRNQRCFLTCAQAVWLRA
jgi:hypothetical protein